MPVDALSVSCAQLTRDLLAIAKFLFYTVSYRIVCTAYNSCLLGATYTAIAVQVRSTNSFT